MYHDQHDECHYDTLGKKRQFKMFPKPEKECLVLVLTHPCFFFFFFLHEAICHNKLERAFLLCFVSHVFE